MRRLNWCIGSLLLLIILSGCPSFSLISPSFNYNRNSGDNNPNQVSCNTGAWYSSPYCSIPLSRFIGITSNYASPFNKYILIDYQQVYGHFIFDDVFSQQHLESVNTYFLANYPTINNYAMLPDSLQQLYTKIKDEYIPQHNYQKLAEAYIYLYTISALDLATNPCNELVAKNGVPTTQNPDYNRLFMIYKAFSIQYANTILNHIACKVDGTYRDELTLYNKVYAAILDLNPYQLQNLAEATYAKTNVYAPASYESEFVNSGADFGELGRFSCTANMSTWYRFGYEYFGVNISGILFKVHFKNKDTFQQYDANIIPVSN